MRQWSAIKSAFSSFHTTNLDAIWPPSTNNVAPVIYDARSDARNATALATSSALPPLPSGMSRKYSLSSIGSEKDPAVRRVRISPGHTAVTRICHGPSSLAAVRNNPINPALLALYAVRLASPSKEFVDAEANLTAYNASK